MASITPAITVISNFTLTNFFSDYQGSKNQFAKTRIIYC